MADAMMHKPENRNRAASTPGQGNGAILRLCSVERTFAMGEVAVHVLRGVSLDVRRGEVLAVVGPSGSGKTTILNIVGGLDQPTAGEVWYRDRNLAQATRAELTRYRREEVGFVFQFYNLAPNLTARENVLVAAEISARPMDVDDVLDRVGLADRMDHFPAQLSGGEQQRVAIARAVVKNPELLLCDEPTGALDFPTGIRTLRLLVDLNRETGKTVVIITHNAAIAAIADRVVHLRSGEITEITEQPRPLPPEEVSW